MTACLTLKFIKTYGSLYDAYITVVVAGFNACKFLNHCSS